MCYTVKKVLHRHFSTVLQNSRPKECVVQTTLKADKHCLPQRSPGRVGTSTRTTLEQEGCRILPQFQTSDPVSLQCISTSLSQATVYFILLSGLVYTILKKYIFWGVLNPLFLNVILIKLIEMLYSLNLLKCFINQV